MSRITTPKPGFWLRVEPGREVKVVTVKLGYNDKLWFDDCFDTGGPVEGDRPEIYYLPISLELLEAAAAMAEAILHDLQYIAQCAAADYRAAVAKAVGE